MSNSAENALEIINAAPPCFGDKLANGAIVIDAELDHARCNHGWVIANKRHGTPFVVWNLFRDTGKSWQTGDGSYFDYLDDAIECYYKRRGQF